MKVLYEALYSHYKISGFKSLEQKNGVYYVFESEKNLTRNEAVTLRNELNNDFHNGYIHQAIISG